MKKKNHELLLLLISLSIFFQTLSAQNLVSNPGFESTATPWVVDNWAQNQVTASRISSNPHSGNYCFKVDMTAVINTPNVMLAYPGLAVKPGMAVKIKFWARGQSNGLALTTLVRKGQSPYTAYFRTEGSLSDQWQEYSYTAVMPADLDTVNVNLRFMLSSVGFFCIDDVSVVALPGGNEATVPVLNPLRNASFESGTDGWTATIRQDEFGTPSKESGNIAPTSEESALLIRTDTSAPFGRNYLSFSIPAGCRATITSANFHCRYNQPLRLRFSVRANGNRHITAGIGSGKKTISQLGATFTASGQWQEFNVPLTLPVTVNQPYFNYFVYFQSSEQASFDIDGVSVVEDVQTSPVLFPMAVAVEALSNASPGHIYYPNDTISFKLTVANASHDTTMSYQLSVTNYLGKPIWDSIVQVSQDFQGYGNTIFRVPSAQKGGFRVNVHTMDSSTPVLAEQLYSVVPVLPEPAEHPTSFFGAHVDLTSFNLEIARKGGFRWLRLYPPFSTLWMAMETSPGIWKFDSSRIAAAHRMGFKLMSGFNTAPDFAADMDTSAGVQNRWSTPYPPSSINRWKDYIVKCYNAFQPYIDAWEIWNEPDWNYLKVRPGLKKDSVYLSLLKSAREVFDSTGQPVTLVGPALANMNDSLGWSVLNHGGDSLLDGYSFHIYELHAGGNSPDNNYITPILSRMKSYSNIASDTMPLWITEGGTYLYGASSWLSTYNVPASTPLSVAQAAAAVTRSALYFKAMGAKRYLEYQVYASPTGRRIYQDGTSAFIDVNGTATPAMAAHAAMVLLLDDAAPIGFEAINGTAVKAAHFKNDTTLIDVYWSGNITPLSTVTTLQPGDQLLDMMGNPLTGENIEIGEYPIYVIRRLPLEV